MVLKVYFSHLHEFCIHGENQMSCLPQPNLLFKIYDEALKIMDQARSYAQKNGPMDFVSEDAEQGLIIAMEVTRISSRMTQVVAWYLTQKAYLEGKITLFEARSEVNKVSYSGELAAHDLNGKVLSRELVGMLKESHSLYERVCRLDDVFWRNTAA